MQRHSGDFENAVRHFQAGQLELAQNICQQIVAMDSGHADAWHLLGVVALQSGKYELAAEYLQRAVTANPSDVEATNNLGVARKALAQWNDAIDCFSRAVALRPNFAEANSNLANALLESGRSQESIEAYRRTLNLRPTDPIIHHGLANALRKTGDASEAIAAYRRALELQPAYAEAHFNLGALYQQASRDEEAIACYSRAVELNPKLAEAYSNLGTILKNHGRLDEAATCFHRALEVKPQDVELNFNWACILLAQGKLHEGTFVLDNVLQMQPDHAEAHYNRSTIRLFSGDFDRGWSEYEWRWKTTQQTPRDYTQPLWTGEPLHRRTILIYAEQGFGDTIQFIRYTSLVKRLGGTVIFECQKPLLPLLANYRDIDHLIGQEDPLPTFDLHAPLLSLPRIFRTDLDSIPTAVPYLFAEPVLVDKWKERLAQITGLQIGINWRGRPGLGSFRQRDIPLAFFAELTAIPNVQLISLHRGPGQQDLINEASGLQILDLGDDLDRENGAFMDTAAVMRNLDLVITSDTSIAHLAGALAIPVWLALPCIPDWRWLADRSDSPWYPTMRLFRQKSPGDWAGVFKEIKSALLAHVD